MAKREIQLHTQELTVLGLVGLGKRYGFEMEEFIAKTEMKHWNDIGNSTIYKLLKDLSSAGHLEAKKVAGGKGPARNEYTLTGKGEELLRSRILAAFQSDRAAKMDRLVGLFFSPLLPPDLASQAMNRLIGELESAQAGLEAKRSGLKGDVIGEAITGLYRDLQAAEIKAVSKVLASFKQ